MSSGDGLTLALGDGDEDDSPVGETVTDGSAVSSSVSGASTSHGSHELADEPAEASVTTPAAA